MSTTNLEVDAKLDGTSCAFAPRRIFGKEVR